MISHLSLHRREGPSGFFAIFLPDIDDIQIQVKSPQHNYKSQGCVTGLEYARVKLGIYTERVKEGAWLMPTVYACALEIVTVCAQCQVVPQRSSNIGLFDIRSASPLGRASGPTRDEV